MDRKSLMEPQVTLNQCIEALEARRRLVSSELNGFARPIAACDVDFAVLIEEQYAIGRALAALAPVARGEVRVNHPRDGH